MLSATSVQASTGWHTLVLVVDVAPDDVLQAKRRLHTAATSITSDPGISASWSDFFELSEEQGAALCSKAIEIAGYGA